MTNNRKLNLIMPAMLFCWVLLCGIGMAFWPTPQANPQRNGRSDDEGPLVKEERWRFKRDIILDSPVVIAKDGAIYAISQNILYAVNRRGEEVWKYIFNAGGNETGQLTPPSVGLDGTIYTVVLAKGKESWLAAIDPLKGKEKWKAIVSPYPVESWHGHIAVAKNGRIYAAAGNRIAAFEAGGKPEWSFEFSDKEALCNSGPSLSPDEDVIYVYRRCGEGLYAFNKDGSLKWHDKSGYRTHTSPPVIDADGTIYIPDEITASIHAIAPDGRKKWTAGFAGMDLRYSVLAIGGDGTVYTGISNKNSLGGKLFALNKEDGKVRWNFAIKDGWVGNSIAVDKNDKIYFGAGDGNVYALHSGGNLLWKYFIGQGMPPHAGEKINGFAAISEGVFYVITGDGALHAIGKKVP